MVLWGGEGEGGNERKGKEEERERERGVERMVEDISVNKIRKIKTDDSEGWWGARFLVPHAGDLSAYSVYMHVLHE